MSVSAFARPAIFMTIAVALWLAADLLWSIGMEIRETAVNPACQLLRDRMAMGLDCEGQNQFGFFLAITAPFLGFGAAVALIVGIAAATKSLRHLFLRPPLTYHREKDGRPGSGGTSHGFDVTGAAPGNADLRGDKGRYAGLSARAVRGGER